MTPTKIAAKNGKARPKNPYDNEFKDEYHFYAKFESTFQWHDCPECEDGEFEAELVWQVKGPFGIWEDISDLAHDNFRKSNENPVAKSYIMREVWRIVPQPQQKNLSLKASMKFERLIHNNPKSDGDSKGKRLGHFVYDHEKQTETFIPITPKEEAKTVEGKTPEEILSKILNTQSDLLDCGAHCRVSSALEAMQAYSSQQSTAIMEENKRLREALEAIKKHQEIAIKGHPEFSSICSIAKQAIKPKQ